MNRCFTFLLTVFLFCASNAHGNLSFSSNSFASDTFLPVEQAFVFDVILSQDELLLTWNMPSGYYLYAHSISVFDLTQLKAVDLPLPKGKDKFDEAFGDVEVFFESLEVILPQSLLTSNKAFQLRYQGCSDKGLCYPPQEVFIGKLAGTWQVISVPLEQMQASNIATSLLTTNEGSFWQSIANISNTTSNQWMQQLEQQSLLQLLVWFFFGGLLLALTPCVLPMTPILSAIIVRGTGTGTGTGTDDADADADQKANVPPLALSLAYVLGMALAYMLLGMLMGWLGASVNIQAYLQKPLVLSLFALCFALLALSMFDFFQLRLLTASFESWLDAFRQKSYKSRLLSVMLMGVVSAFLVSPCISAPLAGILLFLASTQDFFLSGLMLFVLGLGMGFPLLWLGAGFRFLPSSGLWMDRIKEGIGFSLLLVSIWLFLRIWLSDALVLSFILLSILIFPYYAWIAWSKGQKRNCLFILFIAIVFWGLFLQSFKENAQQFDPEVVYSPQSLQEKMQKAIEDQKILMIDVFAQWCVSCHYFEAQVLNDADVLQQLDSLHTVKLDISEYNEEHRVLLEELKVFGPPAFLFYDPAGQLLWRVQGEVTYDTFLEKISKMNAGNL